MTFLALHYLVCAQRQPTDQTACFALHRNFSACPAWAEREPRSAGVVALNPSPLAKTVLRSPQRRRGDCPCGGLPNTIPRYPLQMALTIRSHLDRVDTSAVQQLGISDAKDLQELYSMSYPGNWFESRMLKTGYYYGVRQGGTLVSVAGVHLYSQQYRVAALGNITTHPQFRGQGLAAAACTKLCQALLPTVDHIGLNVKADNKGAISCYAKLGFEPVATYEEYLLLAALNLSFSCHI